MPPTRIVVNTTFNRGSWLLFFTKPIIEINGVEHKRRWGRHVYPIEPGRHEIKVYYPYLYNYYSCLTTLYLEVSEGQEYRLTYDGTSGIWKGRLTIDDPDENSRLRM